MLKILKRKFLKKKIANIEENNQLSSKYHLEFIGVSGIGKTTLCQLYQEKSKLNFLKKNQLKCISILDQHMNSIYWFLLNSKMRNLNQFNITDKQRLELTRYFLNEVFLDSNLIEQSNSRKVLLEEGLFHNFNKELCTLSDEDFSKVIENRAFVFLNAKNVNIIYNRIHHRIANGGHTNIFHQNLSEVELKSNIFESIKAFKKLVLKIQEQGIPIIQIDAEDSVENQLQVLLKFEVEVLTNINS